MFAEDIKVCNVPHVDSLRSVDLISFIAQNCNGEVYLPRNYTQNILLIEHSLPTFVFLMYIMLNIGNSLDFEGFQQLVKDVLAERQKSLLQKNNLLINIDPRIALNIWVVCDGC